MESIMRIENLTAAYDKKTVLHDISLWAAARLRSCTA